MANLKSILNDVIGEIKPEQRQIKEVDEFVNAIRLQIKKNKIKARALIGGSFAKDTFLKEDHDVDIFVLFDMKYKNDNLSKLLGKILNPMKPEIVHGSRDYFQIKNMLNFEIVPVLDIKKAEHAENVTDFSPEHVKWFIKKGKKYADDVRLAKKFCKAVKVYGAESYINGFSGHVLDILIVNYKGFLPLLKASLKWKQKQVVDFNKVYKGKALFELNKSKTQGNLIVIDPVQPDRNASAALTDEKLKMFVIHAKAFLKKPSHIYFIEKNIDVDMLKKKGAIIVEVASKKGKTDVSGAKLMKAFEFLKKGLSEFKIKNAGWEWDKKKNGVFWFFVLKKKLPETIEWTGPPVKFEKSVKAFKKKYKKNYIKKGRIYAKIKRKHVTALNLINELVKDNYFTDRAKKR